MVVVGAGIAGLAAAWELLREGAKFDVTILESERRAGGVIVTERVDGFVVEGGPDAGTVMTEVAKAGNDAVLLVPIGFVCDHVEILYDIDVEYQALAKRLGIQLERTKSLNDDPGLVAAVADVVRTAAAERGWL